MVRFNKNQMCVSVCVSAHEVPQRPHGTKSLVLWRRQRVKSSAKATARPSSSLRQSRSLCTASATLAWLLRHLTGHSLCFLALCYLEVITRLFSYRPVYQARASITASSLYSWTYLFTNESISLSAVIIYQNMLKVTDEWLIVCCSVYAAATNQRRTSLPVTYGNSKLSYGL